MPPQEPPVPTRSVEESLEVKVDMLLSVFAGQIEEIREERYAQRYATYEERLAKYQKHFAAYEIERAAYDEKEDAVRQVKAQREAKVAEFVTEFKALDDIAPLKYLDDFIAERLGQKFETLDDLRNASSEAILWVQGVGVKTLDAIRKRIHEHTWEKFETEAGKSGSYCDGCKARTGFITC
tara:strand:- start:614 stop:1156 length:543 start_codon:yes stop_codon:yes gene_type:complete